MIRHFSILAFVALSACAVPIGLAVPVPAPQPTVAPPPPPVVNPRSSKERFVTAVEARGCVFNSGNRDAVFEAATVSAGDMQRILTELRAEGRGRILPGGEGFGLTTAACAA